MPTAPTSVPPNDPSEGITDFGIVVGVDGSDGSYDALSLAGEEATRAGMPLTLICAYSMSPWSDSATMAGDGLASDSKLQQLCYQILDEAEQACLPQFEGPVGKLAIFGDPTTLLKDYSHRAHLIVIGSRGRGGFPGRRVGSVASAVPEHSACPTLVVPPAISEESKEGSDGSSVTVGVDDSEYSHYAALEAGRQAQERGLPLRVIRAVPSVRTILPWVLRGKDLEELDTTLQETLRGDREWIGSHYPQVEIHSEVIRGSAVDVLTEVSESSEMVVVGTKGRGGFAGRLIGSTTLGLVAHSTSPVLCVTHHRDQRLQDRKQFTHSAAGEPAEN